MDSLDVIDRLEGDHRHAEDLHQSVDWLYTAWISAGVLEPGDEERLLSQARELKQLYAEHILIEETVVFPHAAQVLNREAIASMGDEFSARRK